MIQKIQVLSTGKKEIERLKSKKKKKRKRLPVVNISAVFFCIFMHMSYQRRGITYSRIRHTSIKCKQKLDLKVSYKMKAKVFVFNIKT